MSQLRPDSQGGFALLESLAVLALSALVLLTLVIAADLVTRNSAAASRRVNETEALATGLAALGREIADAKPIPVGSLKGPLLFHGGPASLGLVRRDERDAAGDTLIWIAATYDGDRGLLVRSAAPLLPQTKDFAASDFADSTAILAGPWTYRFSYAAAGTPSSWVGSWSVPERMPAAVRLEVFDRRDGSRVLPALVTRIRVDSVPGCPQSQDGLCTSLPTAPTGEPDAAGPEL
jgi:general secretion pathway protein J